MRFDIAQTAAVAPYVGAWIETWSICIWWYSFRVAPYVGAWIETFLNAQTNRYDVSHPTWVRGLKH